MKLLEIWGGIECTINRVGDEYFDQLEYTGYYDRKDDIDKIAELGIKAMRYPILWERYQPDKQTHINWDLAVRDLRKLNHHNITPVIGLVHHGSGPRFANFFDGSFETGLSEYAEEVAKKFPFVEYYTPVNEPLTTARFCGLYGHWYPHKRDEHSFVKIIISECKATVTAMQSIRKINPDAKLIQTEDLGKTHSTALLKYQADMENWRRWLGIYLICGKISSGTTMWNYLTRNGVSEDELNYFLENPCVPDILGLNYYITSERFIDESLEHYPASTHGSNFIHQYADVEVVRVGGQRFEGAKAMIREAWERFNLPIAITEAHMHCHRDEQMRWFYSIWKAANELKAEGADIRAVTAWALLGAFGWNKLLTENHKEYEPGVFDVRPGKLRPLALAEMLKSLNHKKSYTHAVLQTTGWWERDMAVIYHRSKRHPATRTHTDQHNVQPLLILGNTGTLGGAIARICEKRNIPYRLFNCHDFNISDPVVIEQKFSELNPWAVINTTGFTGSDDPDDRTELCFDINGSGPANLAKYCKSQHIALLGFSSDMVFDGTKIEPYVETDPVCPINTCGRGNAYDERAYLDFCSDALVIRTGPVFGVWREDDFLMKMIAHLDNNKHFVSINDVFISPVYAPDLVHTCLDLLIDKATGIWHVVNDGATTLTALYKTVAEKLNLDIDLIAGRCLKEMHLAAKRPAYRVLQSEKGIQLPCLDDAVERYLHELLHLKKTPAKLEAKHY